MPAGRPPKLVIDPDLQSRIVGMVKAGAFTMNAGHHRDGAECETAVCQFDDSRTVAAIITARAAKNSQPGQSRKITSDSSTPMKGAMA